MITSYFEAFTDADLNEKGLIECDQVIYAVSFSKYDFKKL